MNDLQFAQDIFDDINAHSLTEGSITRPSYSETETAAMRVVETYAKNAGLRTIWDFAGNLHCVLDGLMPESITGSHLDSVPNGGQYDGVAGVVAGLMVLIQAAKSKKRRTTHQLRLIVFRGEESAWFGKAHMGSSAIFGELSGQDLLRYDTRKNGHSLTRAISRCHETGADPDRIATGEKILEPKLTHRFVEVHIEQGPVLHEAGEPIGLVTSIRGNVRYNDCVVIGESAHSGTTPNHLRRDALMAFTDLVQRLEWGAAAFGEELSLTCGVAGTDPSLHAITIIPGMMKFGFEFRGDTPILLEMFDRYFRTCVGAVMEQRKVNITVGHKTETAPVALSDEERTLMAIWSNDLHLGRIRHMPSGAGHDASVFARQGIHTGMIFIRNEHGSHNPKESMLMDDFFVATELLYRVMTNEKP